MPPQQVHDAAHYRFRSGEQLLIDSNIWLDVHGPAWLVRSQKRLSISSHELLTRCRDAGCRMYSNQLIHSEVIYRIARIGYERSGSRLRFKEWRDATISAPIFKKAHSALQHVLADAPHFTENLRMPDYQQIADDLVRTHADFNDLVLARLCANHSLTMVSNDRDMLDLDFPLLVTGLN